MHSTPVWGGSPTTQIAHPIEMLLRVFLCVSASLRFIYRVRRRPACVKFGVSEERYETQRRRDAEKYAEKTSLEELNIRMRRVSLPLLFSRCCRSSKLIWTAIVPIEMLLRVFLCVSASLRFIYRVRRRPACVKFGVSEKRYETQRRRDAEKNAEKTSPEETKICRRRFSLPPSVSPNLTWTANPKEHRS